MVGAGVLDAMQPAPSKTVLHRTNSLSCSLGPTCAVVILPLGVQPCVEL